MDAYAELIHRWKEAGLLGSCAAVLGWDERTYMPRNGSAHRAEQLALLARLGHERVTDPKIGELIASVEGQRLDPDPAANVRERQRAYDRAVKLPPELVEEMAIA